MLTIEKLTSGYGKLTILRDLTMNIDAESVGLFGPNGAGKTTLINAVLGINPAWSGKIIFHGEDITGLPTHEVARRGIALVPQERELFPSLSVVENLELGAAFIPHAKDNWEDTLEEVYSLFPILKERAKQPAGTMSGGQQRMLAIGRALMAKPKLLILDEPSLGLQPSIVNELFTILHDMKKKIAVLVTEQNVRESLRAVDRGYVLENGMIAMNDSSDKLANDPHVLEAYLGI
ncbi:MAG TPA: branched-chain amino acid ABC transporter ATP-binding protein [Spirochaeta sp.]|nr:branched-chain amino acid ABC transporter ATP-binding protein [Spirochaeta sp.]